MNRYAILTHKDDYVVEWAELDGYHYPLYEGQIYDEIEAETRGQARAKFIKAHWRSHVEFTDGMSIRIMKFCDCGGDWECPKCWGSQWSTSVGVVIATGGNDNG